MTALLILIPAALFLGALGLVAFLWTVRSGQYEDLDGAAARILNDDDMEPEPEPGPAHDGHGQRTRFKR